MISQFSRDLCFKWFNIADFLLRSSETIWEFSTQVVYMLMTLSVSFKLIDIDSHLSRSNVLIHYDIFSFLDLRVKFIKRSLERTLWITHLRLHEVVNLNDWVKVLLVLLNRICELLTVLKNSLLINRSFLCS